MAEKDPGCFGIVDAIAIRSKTNDGPFYLLLGQLCRACRASVNKPYFLCRAMFSEAKSYFSVACHSQSLVNRAKKGPGTLRSGEIDI